MIDNNKPLLVMEYEAGRVLWRLFFPHSLIYLLFGNVYINKFIKVWSEECNMKDCFFLVFLGFILIGITFLIIEMFLMKNIKFYPNKIEKEWSLFGTKSLLYSNTRLRGVTMSQASTKTFLYLVKPKWYKYICFSYDERLISKFNKKKAIEILAQVSKRETAELMKTRIELNPFINLK